MEDKDGHSEPLCEGSAGLQRRVLVLVKELIEGCELFRGMAMSGLLLLLLWTTSLGGRGRRGRRGALLVVERGPVVEESSGHLELLARRGWQRRKKAGVER